MEIDDDGTTPDEPIKAIIPQVAVVPRVENKSVPRFEINRWGEVQYVTLADDLETVVRSELDRDCAYRLHGELSRLLSHSYREPVEGVIVNAESIGRIYDKWASVYHDSSLPETKSSLVYAMYDHFLHHVKGVFTPPPSKNVREECGWTHDEWSESWSAGCGAEWIFPDGGPDENDMKFCPSCGKPVALDALSDKGGV